MKLKNVFYHHTLLKIGGIETFLYNMAKMYSSKYDITIVYSHADPKQIARLSEYVNCIKLTNGIECEKLFLTYDTSIINKIKADEYVQVVHADYKLLKVKPNTHPKISEYIAVSKTAAESWKDLSGIDCKVIYNPIKVDKPKRMLRLISATRLTKEKGRGRMEQLAELLTDASIPFQWLVYTDSPEGFKNPNIIKVPPRLDITEQIANADYLVQLSDTEGYCYSVNEALNLNIPVIVTDLETFAEQGVTNGENGYLLPLDMVGVDVQQIYENIPKFTYKPKKCEWAKELVKGESEYTNMFKQKTLVEATDEYKKRNVTDAVLKKIPSPGERFFVDGNRIDILLGNNQFKVPFVKLVKNDPPSEKTATTKRTGRSKDK